MAVRGPRASKHGSQPRAPAGGVIVPRARLDALAAAAYPAFNEPAILPAKPEARFAARHDVVLHRLEIPSQVPGTGERVRLTGLLAVPQGVTGRLPVVSWQHGTILSFGQVPSGLLRLADPAATLSDAEDSLETLFNLHRLAGQGFAVIAADYIGKGPLRNGRGEAYAVRAVSVQGCLDILAAGLARLRALGHRPGALFLNGWSQGGLNTQWLVQALQRGRRKVTAAAAQSPFHNLAECLQYWSGAMPGGDGGPGYPPLPNWVSLCVIIVLGSYRHYHQLPGLFGAAIKPKYLELAETFWRDYDLQALPRDIPPVSELLVEGFWERFTAPENGRLLQLLAADAASPFVYAHPLRLYYGLADQALHPRLMGLALAGNGPQVQPMPVPGGSHRGTFLASLYGEATVPDWFRSLLPAGQ